MSEENKDRGKFDFPMMPIFGVDLGERLGTLVAGQKQLENGLKEVKQDLKEVDARLSAKIDAIDAKFEAKTDALGAKIDAIDAKFEAKTDKMDHTLHRLDERIKALAETHKSDRTLMVGFGISLWVTVVAGIILQYFFSLPTP